MRLARGALIVVGGHSRGVGKTWVIEQLLRANGGEGWIAIKISAHRHAPAEITVPLVEESWDTSSNTQTGRYLAAGARRAFLVRAPDRSLGGVAAFIAALRETSHTVVVESNRIVQWLVPDFLVFVVDPLIDDWKPSSAYCLPLADTIVRCRLADGSWRAAAVPAIQLPRFRDCSGLRSRNHPSPSGLLLPSASGS